jgi:hypothetical protein
MCNGLYFRVAHSICHKMNLSDSIRTITPHYDKINTLSIDMPIIILMENNLLLHPLPFESRHGHQLASYANVLREKRIRIACISKDMMTKNILQYYIKAIESLDYLCRYNNRLKY